MSQPEAAAVRQALDRVRSELVRLCVGTEDDAALLQVAQSDSEGKQGAFARGRIHEARAIRHAMAEAIHTKILELTGR